MQHLLNENIGLFTILFLIILLCLMNMRKEVNKYSTRLLVFIVCYLIVLVVFDVFLDMTRDGHINLSRNVAYILFTIEILLPAIVTGMVVSYFDYKLIGSLSRIVKRHYYMILLYVYICVAFLNLFYPLIFTINEQSGLYEQAPYTFLLFFGNYVMFSYIVVMLLKRRKYIDFKPIMQAVLFFILPIIGSILEMTNVTDSFTWPLLSLACLFIYVDLETTSGTKDFLTNLYTRQTLDDYVRFLVEKKKTFTLLMIDLDKFKSLNDEQGHLVGDLVLKSFSKHLRDTFNEKMIARLGGDEFIVIVEKDIDIKKTMKDLEHKLRINNHQFIKQVRFSYGYEKYIEALTLDKLFNKVDQKLYQQKEEKKSKYYHQRY